jgi:hypothetical protein
MGPGGGKSLHFHSLEACAVHETLRGEKVFFKGEHMDHKKMAEVTAKM